MNCLSTIFDSLKRHQQRGVLRIIDDNTTDLLPFLKEFFTTTEKKTAWFVSPESIHGADVNRQNEWRLKKYRQYLGEEYDVVVMDLKNGLNLEALAALAGTIKLGGILVLITQNDDMWSQFPDPETQRIASHPHTVETLSRRFISYFIGVLKQSAGVITLDADMLTGITSSSSQSTANNHLESFLHGLSKTQLYQANLELRENSQFVTDDQARVAAEIIPRLNDQARCIISITADRGRGKSSLLGIALRQYLNTGVGDQVNKRVAVISASKDSLTVLKHHLNTEANPNVTFIAADQLLSLRHTHFDVIVVDEAASYPLLVIKALAHVANKLVLATTVHGYEGTGRGYFYKLKPWLEQYATSTNSEFYTTTLSEPIRWNTDDHLEQFINKSLKLDVELPAVSEQDVFDIKSIEIKPLTHQQLENKAVVDTVFSMLVHAHYQTSPNDLRAIFDGPDQELFAIYVNQRIVGTVWLTYEGYFDDSLTAAIAEGRRRPRGHLATQSLIAHCGYEKAGSLRIARITRIAVHPLLQSLGIGSLALKELKTYLLNNDKADLLSTSFGLSSPLFGFWAKNSFKPLRLGLKPETSTGEYSLLMMSDLESVNQTKPEIDELLTFWQARFYDTYRAEKALEIRIPAFDDVELNRWLHHTYSDESVCDVGSYQKWSIKQHRFDLVVFAQGFRSPDSCILAHQWALQTVSDKTGLELITAKYLDGTANTELIIRHALTGEKQLIKVLRSQTQVLLARL